MSKVVVHEKTVSTGFLKGEEAETIDVPLEACIAVESAGRGRARIYWVEESSDDSSSVSGPSDDAATNVEEVGEPSSKAVDGGVEDK